MYAIYVKYNVVTEYNDDLYCNQVFNSIKTNLSNFDYESSLNN